MEGGDEWRLSGRISPDETGHARRVDLSLTCIEANFTKPREWRWAIDYFYETPLSLPFLPSRIRTHLINKSNNRVLDEYRIFALEASSTTLPASLFDYGKYAISNSMVYFVSNHSIVRFAEGRWQRRMDMKDPRINSVNRPGTKNLRIAYLVLVVLLFAPLLILWGRRNRKDSNPSANEPKRSV